MLLDFTSFPDRPWGLRGQFDQPVFSSVWLREYFDITSVYPCTVRIHFVSTSYLWYEVTTDWFLSMSKNLSVESVGGISRTGHGRHGHVFTSFLLRGVRPYFIVTSFRPTDATKWPRSAPTDWCEWAINNIWGWFVDYMNSLPWHRHIASASL